MDLAVVIRGVEALTGEVSIVCVNVAALSIDNLKFYASQRLSGLLIQLADNQRTGGFIPEGEILSLARLDLDALGPLELPPELVPPEEPLVQLLPEPFFTMMVLGVVSKT